MRRLYIDILSDYNIIFCWASILRMLVQYFEVEVLMNQIIKKRLEECNISIEDVLSTIEYNDKKDAIFIYTSHLEGLGTKNSDFDIYVIGTTPFSLLKFKDRGVYSVQNKIIKGIYFDIEYWNKDDIEKIIDSTLETDFGKFSVENLKLLQRISISEAINSNELEKDLISKIEKSNFRNQIIRLFTVLANSELEDALNMYKAKEYLCALKCARESLDNAIAALNAKNGYPNLKNKWIPKIFVSHNCNAKYFNEYLQLQYFSSVSKENIESHIREILEFTQNLLSNLVVSVEGFNEHAL